MKCLDECPRCGQRYGDPNMMWDHYRSVHLGEIRRKVERLARKISALAPAVAEKIGSKLPGVGPPGKYERKAVGMVYKIAALLSGEGIGRLPRKIVFGIEGLVEKLKKHGEP